VTRAELRTFTDNIIDVINMNHARYAATLEERKISSIVDRLEALEVHIPPAVHEPNGDEEDEHARCDEELRRRLHNNRQGMGGNNANHQDNRDPFSKVKFTIPAFYGAYDAEVYLDWEMTVEQKLNSHLVPDVHKVRQATSEFKDFAIVWWNELFKSGTDPQTCDRLKLAMRSRFVRPSYKCDLHKKLQCLD
jgi:hypothetical protein